MRQIYYFLLQQRNLLNKEQAYSNDKSSDKLSSKKRRINALKNNKNLSTDNDTVVLSEIANKEDNEITNTLVEEEQDDLDNTESNAQLLEELLFNVQELVAKIAHKKALLKIALLV